MMTTAATTNATIGRPPDPGGVVEVVELTVTDNIFEWESDPFVTVMLSE
jgi:hypothetical protein